MPARRPTGGRTRATGKRKPATAGARKGQKRKPTGTALGRRKPTGTQPAPGRRGSGGIMQGPRQGQGAKPGRGPIAAKRKPATRRPATRRPTRAKRR